jgi:hypothetical protein
MKVFLPFIAVMAASFTFMAVVLLPTSMNEFDKNYASVHRSVYLEEPSQPMVYKKVLMVQEPPIKLVSDLSTNGYGPLE